MGALHYGQDVQPRDLGEFVQQASNPVLQGVEGSMWPLPLGLYRREWEIRHLAFSHRKRHRSDLKVGPRSARTIIGQPKIRTHAEEMIQKASWAVFFLDPGSHIVKEEARSMTP